MERKRVRMSDDELFIFASEHLEYKDGFLICKKSWSKDSESKIGKVLCNTTRKQYNFISIKRVEYLSHRIIYMLCFNEKPDVVDHIDRDKRNNFKENLRSGSKSNNEINREKYKTNSSGYKGVWFHSQRQKWCAEITIKGKGKKLGLFDTKESAAIAYNEAATKEHGNFAYLNEIKEK